MTGSEATMGGCLCDGLRYRLLGPLRDVVHCHCRMCQKASGAPVVTWLTLPKSCFEVVNGELRLFNSSDHGQRGSCGICGAQITFWTRRHADDIDVTVASLDDPRQVSPQRHIWTKSQISWLHLNPELPASPESSAPSSI